METVTIGDGEVQVDYLGENWEGRDQYSLTVEWEGNMYYTEEFYGGVNISTEESEMLGVAIDFLVAAGESYRYGDGEMSQGYPDWLIDWVMGNSDELNMEAWERSGEHDN